MSDSLRPHGLQHAREPYPSPTPRACSNSCPSRWWCHPAHPTISSSVVPFSRLQSFPASRPFPMSRLFTSGSQRTGVSASASLLPMNLQGWFPLGWAGVISLLSKVSPIWVRTKARGVSFSVPVHLGAVKELIPSGCHVSTHRQKKCQMPPQFPG